MALTFGPRTEEGSVSATDLGAASPALWVISVVKATAWSPLSRTAVTLNAGANFSDEQPVTVSGAPTLRTVESL